MALEVIGKLVRVLPEQSGVSGAGKAWKKQDFVVETEDQYPKNVCITAFGDKSEILSSLQEGERLKVFIDLESREYNSKWYTNVNLWKLERMNASGGGASSEPAATNSYTGGGNSIPVPPPVSTTEGDDLPF
jgi:hypothetical protein